MGHILIIDDEEQLRKLLARIISLEGFKVMEAGTLKQGIDFLSRQEFDVILSDVKLPDGNGVDFVKTAKKQYPSTEVILVTAYGNIPDGVQAIKNGAFDYIIKGDDNERILPLLHQAVQSSVLNRNASVRINEKAIDFSAVIGKSQEIKDAIRIAEKIAPTKIPVLLLGETGSGKEVFANAIHHNSKGKEHAFVAINCSAFNRELLESELFGHKAGAFTGAIKDKKGLVEVADRGTLFLDEIGEMNIDLQSKLLRFLENGQFIKLGDSKVLKCDVRIIAATNKDLAKEVDSKSFRDDLYYRLNAITIKLPALRERKEDIPLLTNFFLKQIAARENKSVTEINQIALQMLQKYGWKGNVRELKNVLERAVILGGGTEILPEHLPFEIQQQEHDVSLSLAAVEGQHIRKILQYTHGNKTKAAQLMEIGLATLYRKMDEYGIPK
jgi:two-component system NtrC family response regulator